MIKGMTGYGSSQFSVGKIKIIAEVKSLNHRYFDITCFLPIGFGSIENKIQQVVKKFVQRGKVTASVKILEKPQQAIELNKNAVKVHLRNANALKREFGLKNDLTVADLVKLPGVLDAKEILVDPVDIWPGLEKALNRSLSNLEEMRKREGRSLYADISDKLTRMLGQLKKIKAQAKAVLQEKRKILNEDEFRSFQKSNDVNEEISRLAHYIDELKKLLRNNIPVGKNIDFIAQEMQRETNTIGSKLQDKIVSNAVIALKSKIEKIREQAQNVE